MAASESGKGLAMTVTDEMLIAYLDGELDADSREAIETALSHDQLLAARLERHRAFARAAKGGPTRPAEVVALDALRKKRNAPPPKPKPAVSPNRKSWGVAAVGMAVGLALGILVPRGSGNAQIDGQMTARGKLAGALESQLAATQDADAPVRVGLTFRNQAGGWCRTFAASGRTGLTGVACRDGGLWKVRVAAASNPSAVTAAVQGLIKGEPVDAAGEKAAWKRSWKTN